MKKNFETTIIITFIVCAAVALLFSCQKQVSQEPPAKEIATAKSPAVKNCFTVCDVTKNPDLQLVTNVTDQPQVDGVIDSSTYFWKRYHVRTYPIRLLQNYLTRGIDAIKYGWDSGVLVNRVQLQCLIENIAPFGCGNDWAFTESQGYLVGQNIFFDGLFQFDTYEKGNGNNWKLLYSDYKKEFFPDAIPNTDYIYEMNFCYNYERAVQAQTGDFYYNYFRFPDHDGTYKLVIKFNPLIKGCHAIKETNYDNSEVTYMVQITNGTVIIN